MELKRLNKSNYDELIALMNFVFSNKDKREHSFEADLPSMCRRTDEAMNKHLGVFEDGKLVAALGIYPLPCKIFGEDFLFSTVGNVATHPDYEGRGYMGIMMNAAMEELERIGADASRLGGARQRYNRFGYEMAGVAYKFTIIDHNTKHAFGDIGDYTFERIERENTDAFLYVKSLHEKEKIYAKRSSDEDCFGVWASAVAWQSVPYIVKKNGKRVGYVSIAKDEVTVSELYAESEDVFVEALVAYQRKIKKAIFVRLPDYEPALLSRLAAFAHDVTTSPVCRFKIINFADITDALMKLKASYTDMPDGEFLLGIKDYGTLRLYAKDGKAGAELCEGDASIILDKLAATRLLFGHTPATLIADVPQFVRLWLPLPLYWNLQDRV
ncbi:MAG: GNAT family N-acetyltransferase [Clostridia bacterium]|nr:GNAT family N-acetyltransferase [Clostridia bacterium]MBR3715453.1 GNAT family N-acetyltransferase [Clostridia bacterium]